MVSTSASQGKRGETAPRERSRARAASRRDRILNCADSVFLECGVQSASMSVIAVRVGGSKQTLYNYFASKEDLFLACAKRHCLKMQEQMSALCNVSGEPRHALEQIGKGYAALVSSEDTVRKFRMIAAEAERAPAIARQFYLTGPVRAGEVLAIYLEHAMAAGTLKRADPQRAAHQFLSLCCNHLFEARLCKFAPAPDDVAIAEDVVAAVRLFMASYGVTPGARRR